MSCHGILIKIKMAECVTLVRIHSCANCFDLTHTQDQEAGGWVAPGRQLPYIGGGGGTRRGRFLGAKVLSSLCSLWPFISVQPPSFKQKSGLSCPSPYLTVFTWWPDTHLSIFLLFFLEQNSSPRATGCVSCLCVLRFCFVDDQVHLSVSRVFAIFGPSTG